MGVPRLPHLLGIEGLAPETISGLLDLSESYIDQNRSIDKRRDVLAGRTVINLFFENSTRTRTSFEVAAKRLGADVINMDVATSSVRPRVFLSLKRDVKHAGVDPARRRFGG